jgi:hypothetical protein
MTASPYTLDNMRRRVVLEAICAVCHYRRWTRLAAQVRTTHVHAVVEAESDPERVLNDFKAYASRKLNDVEPERKRWARHGSTRWLWNPRQASAAMQYVLEEQGEAMARFSSESEPRPSGSGG